MSLRKNTVYKILFKASAQKELKKLPKQTYLLIKEAIDKLATNPRPKQSRKLVGGTSQWRLRVGDYRIVYEIIDKQLIIEIVRVKHRKDVYRK